MITPEEHKKQINKVKRSYESILIDIMFSLVDIEDIIETQSFPIEDIEKKIEELKRNIGKSLED